MRNKTRAHKGIHLELDNSTAYELVRSFKANS